ncbi:Putative hydrolase [hydrothermal vent metagenome]|uniref:Hydrolase n=1 Tax=hydrothermal vent metagenome TaxID=652676 RepID=A0A3B0S7S4_9ZZZZ
MPLAALEGKKPPAPDWFQTCLDTPYEDGMTRSDGADICYRVWGKAGRPGLILVHGGVAHKSWWDFIAPFFTPHYRVMAVDLSGMGSSDWREFYDMPKYADEVLAAANAAGLFEAKEKPWLVGHSFGGFVALGFTARHGDKIQGAVVIDSPVRQADKQRRSAPPSRGGRVYDSLPAALARFRLLPSQQCENLFLVDHIARHSLKEVDGGWTWRFDPNLWSKMRYNMRAAIEVLNELKAPVTLIRGAQSSLVTDEVWDFMKQAFPKSCHHVSIPGARHHVMLDQPLALVSVLRCMFGSGI